MHVLARDYRFDGSMSEEVLRSYLSRSMTTMYLLTSHGDFDDNLRMLTNCGVKFAGRAVYQRGREEGGAPAIPKKREQAKAKAAKIHGGFVRDGKLLFDFHTFPLRIEELPAKPKETQLRAGYTDAIYGRSRGGITPSGWRCEHLPYLVEFDNYGRSRRPGEAGQGRFWVWAWVEITWFSQQPENVRNDWLRYAWNWVREHDPDGYVQMPGMRIISGAADGKRWYDVNQPSSATPNGFGQEQAVRAIWASDTSSAPVKR